MEKLTAVSCFDEWKAARLLIHFRPDGAGTFLA